MSGIDNVDICRSCSLKSFETLLHHECICESENAGLQKLLDFRPQQPVSHDVRAANYRSLVSLFFDQGNNKTFSNDFLSFTVYWAKHAQNLAMLKRKLSLPLDSSNAASRCTRSNSLEIGGLGDMTHGSWISILVTRVIMNDYHKFMLYMACK